jgi:hypothetical protein
MSTEIDRLRAELKKWRKYFQDRSILWCLLHCVSAFGSAVASVIIGVLVQRPNTWTSGALGRDDFLTLLALFVATVTVAAAVGGFERKWHSSRLSRIRVDLLRLEFSEPQANVQGIRSTLKKIVASHDRALILFLREIEEHAALGPPKKESQSNTEEGAVKPPIAQSQNGGVISSNPNSAESVSPSPS